MQTEPAGDAVRDPGVGTDSPEEAARQPPTPPQADLRWYVALDGKPYGPIDAQTLRQRGEVRRGSIVGIERADMLVCLAGLLCGSVGYVMLHVVAEAVAVLLHIEQNTRQAAEAAEALLERQAGG